MKTELYPSEVAVGSLYLALPGCEVRPVGVVLLDRQADQLYCKINAITKDKDVSEVLRFMADDLGRMAKEQGGAVIFKFVQESLSNVVRTGDFEQMFVLDHPVNAIDRIFSERVPGVWGPLHTHNVGKLTASNKIFLVEDNVSDVALIKIALREYAPTSTVTVATDGEQALQFINSVGTILTAPKLVVLDLNLPKVSGHEVLKSLRANSRLKSTPVAVLTSSTWPEEMEQAYQEGANLCLHKATDLAGFNQSISDACSLLRA